MAAVDTPTANVREQRPAAVPAPRGQRAIRVATRKPADTRLPVVDPHQVANLLLDYTDTEEGAGR